jgi:hypothetical protein
LYLLLYFWLELITYTQSHVELVGLTTMFHTTVIFVIVDLQTIFYAQFVSMFIIYCHTKFHIPSSNCSLVITVKLKAKGHFLTATMLLYHILQKSYLNINCTFLIFYYHT